MSTWICISGVTNESCECVYVDSYFYVDLYVYIGFLASTMSGWVMWICLYRATLFLCRATLFLWISLCGHEIRPTQILKPREMCSQANENSQIMAIRMESPAQETRYRLVCTCMYVHIHVYIYTYIHVHAYVYIYI